MLFSAFYFPVYRKKSMTTFFVTIDARCACKICHIRKKSMLTYIKRMSSDKFLRWVHMFWGCCFICQLLVLIAALDVDQSYGAHLLTLHDHGL